MAATCARVRRGSSAPLVLLTMSRAVEASGAVVPMPALPVVWAWVRCGGQQEVVFLNKRAEGESGKKEAGRGPDKDGSARTEG